MASLSFQIISLFYILLVGIICFSKERIDTLENRCYTALLIVTFLTLIADCASVFIALIDVLHPLTNILCKLYLVFIIAWVFCFTYYVFVISSKKNKGNVLINRNENYTYFRNIFYKFIFIFVIFILFIVIMPLYIFSNGEIMYTYGPCAIISYIVAGICIVSWLVMICLNFKEISNKKYIPMFCFIILASISAFLQFSYPQLLLITSAAAFITILTYFTIENPDVKMLEQVNLAKKHAEKANAAKTDFLSSMSHEIRTPLNAIIGFSGAIDEEKDLASAKNDAKDIILAANNLLEIVNGILDISKIEANKMEIVEKDYNPTELFESIAKLTAPRIGEKPIELNVNIAKDLPACLFGDGGKVKQITTNILTNAIKYTEEGSINYTVSCVNLKNESSLVISVEDTGRGIKSEQIDKLFTKFERLEEDRNTTLEGTGLGLAITKNLVEMMGGNIVVQSVYGSGSKFTVYLKQKISHRLQSPNYQTEETINNIKDFTGKKVLIVDDNLLNLKVANRLLKSYNLDITQASSGFECIDMINNKKKFDLILMDDMMPKMTGTETFEKLRKDITFKIPVVILTANAIEGMKSKYLEKGFDDYLAKPIEKTELERVLNTFLSTKVNHAVSNEKVEIENKAEAKEDVAESTSNDDGTSSTNTKQYLESQGIDVAHGIELLGDFDTYNSIMEDFVKEMEERLPKLQEYKDNSDMPNYAILVHAIKSDCKYLGIMDLAEHNYQHELRSKACDVDFVNSDYDSLIDDINHYLEICKKYLEI